MYLIDNELQAVGTVSGLQMIQMEQIVANAVLLLA